MGLQYISIKNRRNPIQITERGHAAIFVAVLNGEVVGWIYVADHLVVGGDTFAEIHGLVTDEKYRKQGAGRALVNTAKQWTLQQGLKILRVRTNLLRSEANAFYPKAGFSLLKQQNIYSVTL
jgi:GNAT superfamily N-acetyltransferase